MSRGNDAIALLRRAIELAMPNLRHYYRVLRKGRVVKAYASNGSYWADVQPIRNDESDDESSPVVPMVEIPILWAGDRRGVVCPPVVGTLCDIEYYDGDPDYPRISNFRWPRGKAPACELDAFVIQQKDGVYIKIAQGGKIIIETSADVSVTAGGNAEIIASGSADVEAGGKVTVKGNKVDIDGGGPLAGVVNGLCLCSFTGGPHPDKSATVMASK